MIIVHPSPTADTRTCDYATVTKAQLLDSSRQHILDIQKALHFFSNRLAESATHHDPDKLTDIDGFHADFVTGFKQTGWWERHKKLNRHHLTDMEGIPVDVNLIDVLDFIADCVMSGMARSGSVYPLKLDIGVLEQAFQNTVSLLTQQIVVEPNAEASVDEDDCSPVPESTKDTWGPPLRRPVPLAPPPEQPEDQDEPDRREDLD